MKYLAFLCNAKICLILAMIINLCIVETIEAATQQLRTTNNRLFITISVNGVTTEALLDSGAEMSLIDGLFADTLSLNLNGSQIAKGTGGSQKVQFASGVNFDILDVKLLNRNVAVLDLSDISKRIIGKPVKVIVGREFFDSARIQLSFRDKSISTVKKDLIPSGAELPLTNSHGIKQFPLQFENSAKVLADFDLGNGSEVLIGAKYATKNNLLTPARLIGKKPGGGIGGSIERNLVMLKKINIAGKDFSSITAAIDPTDNAADINVGVSILKSFDITVDFSENRLWLLPID